LALLALGVFRIVRLIGWDDITARVRAAATMPDADYDSWIGMQHSAEQSGESLDRWLERHNERGPSGFRWWLARLIRCPWCLGVWVALPVWAAWLTWPSGTLGAMTPLAIMSVVGLVAKNLDP